MTKKDYIQLAKLFKKYNLLHIESKSLHEFLFDLCDLLKQDNINFKEKNFIKACIE